LDGREPLEYTDPKKAFASRIIRLQNPLSGGFKLRVLLAQVLRYLVEDRFDLAALHGHLPQKPAPEPRDHLAPTPSTRRPSAAAAWSVRSRTGGDLGARCRRGCADWRGCSVGQQRRRKKQRRTLESAQDNAPCLLGRLAIFRKLQIVFDGAGLIARSDFAVGPGTRIDKGSAFRHF
jgi:hypothetical protein